MRRYGPWRARRLSTHAAGADWVDERAGDADRIEGLGVPSRSLQGKPLLFGQAGTAQRA